MAERAKQYERQATLLASERERLEGERDRALGETQGAGGQLQEVQVCGQIRLGGGRCAR